MRMSEGNEAGCAREVCLLKPLIGVNGRVRAVAQQGKPVSDARSARVFRLIKQCVASNPKQCPGTPEPMPDASRKAATNYTFFKLIPPIAKNGGSLRRAKFISDIVATPG
jgi:hypothetical protein